jgi:hypothetical protein
MEAWSASPIAGEIMTHAHLFQVSGARGISRGQLAQDRQRATGRHVGQLPIEVSARPTGSVAEKGRRLDAIVPVGRSDCSEIVPQATVRLSSQRVHC